jgi:hypothetical protein
LAEELLRSVDREADAPHGGPWTQSRLLGFGSRTGTAEPANWLDAYDDSAAFCLLARSLGAAQNLRMRSDIARRFAGVSRCLTSRRLGAGSFDFAVRVPLVCPDDASGVAEVTRAPRKGGRQLEGIARDSEQQVAAWVSASDAMRVSGETSPAG